MPKILKSKLKEVLSDGNMSEGFIKNLFLKLKKSKDATRKKILHKKLAALTDEPEYQAIMKKYNLKPFDWSKPASEYSVDDII